jgi:hypothetical protein
MIGNLGEVFRQTDMDIFLIDWEGPRGRIYDTSKSAVEV